MSNAWGKNIRLSIFGESHGPAAGIVIDGIPAGEVIDFADKETGPEEIRIKTAYCAICGSDPHMVEGNYFPGIELPRPLGHEASGVVVEVGSKAIHRGIKVGDRVAANFVHFCGDCDFCLDGKQQFCLHSREYSRPGMAEYITWHEQQFHKLPDDVSLKEGCLLEPSAICVRMMDKLAPKMGQTVLVCGGGPIGLLALQMLNIYGATSLTMIEPIAERRELAKSFGATHVIDPIKQNVEEEAARITGGKGFDCILDASGALPMMTTLLKLTKRGATIVYGAMYPLDYDMPLNLAEYMYRRELTVTGVLIAPYVFPRTANLLSRLNLKPFTECVYPLDQAHEAFMMNMTGKFPKVLIECNPGME